MLFKSDNVRRKVTLVAGLLFFIAMGQSLITTLMASSSNAENADQAIDNATIESVDLERGYTIVLEREPNNQTALEGLVKTRMAKENWDGVLTPLDQLIVLNPQDERYVTLRKIVEEQKAKSTSSQNNPSQAELPSSKAEMP